MDALKERLQQLGRQVATARAEVDDADAAAKLDKLEATLLDLDKKSANPKITMAGALRAEAQIHAVEASLSHLDHTAADGGPGWKSRAQGFAQAAASLTGLGDAMGVANPEASMFQKVMAGAGLATGLLEPVVAGVTVAVGGMASGLVAAGAGLGIFGEVAKGVWGDYATNIKAATAAQLGLANGDTGAKMAADNKALAGAFKGLHGNVLAMVQGAANAQTSWHNFTTSAADGVASVLAPALSLVPRLLSLAGEFLPPVEDALRHIVSMVSTGLNSSGFQSFVGEMAKLSGPMINNIAVAIGHVVVGIGGILKAFMPMSIGLSVGLDQLTSKFQDWGTSLSSHTGFQSLMETFKSETPQAMKILENLGTVIKNIASAMAGLSTGSNSKALLQVLEPLSGILASLSKNQDLDRIALYLLAAADAGKKLHSAFQGITDVFGKLQEGVDILGRFGKAAEDAGMFSKIAAAATRVWTGIQAAFDVVMDANPIMLVVIAIAALVGAIVLISTKSAAFRAFWKDAWKDIQQIAGDAAKWVVEKLHEAWSDLVNFTHDAWSNIVNWIHSKLAQSKTDVTNWANDVVSWFKKLPGMLLNALASLPGLLFSLGVRALEGLLQGIESKVDEAKAKVAGWGHDIINALGAPFGIHFSEPSEATQMIKAGQQVARGLGTGMLSGTGGLRRAAQSVASAAYPGIAGGSGTGYGATSQAQKIELELSVAGGDQGLMTAFANAIRIRGGSPQILNKKVSFQ